MALIITLILFLYQIIVLKTQLTYFYHTPEYLLTI